MSDITWGEQGKGKTNFSVANHEYDLAFLKVYDELLGAAMKRGFDDRALAFIVEAKKNEDAILRTLRSYPDGERKAAKIETLLQDIPTSIFCNCCGRELRKGINHRGELIIGDECLKHGFPCNSPAASRGIKRDSSEGVLPDPSSRS